MHSRIHSDEGENVILGIGVDLVDITDLQNSIDSQQDAFVGRVFTTEEQQYARQKADPYQIFGGRFAAKEACLKAFATGWTDETDWLDIEVSNEPSGRPILKLKGELAARSSALGVKQAWVSISHVGQYAIAEVILEG
jgi:holo-[acyl-carrier protein] synthase